MPGSKLAPRHNKKINRTYFSMAEIVFVSLYTISAIEKYAGYLKR